MKVLEVSMVSSGANAPVHPHTVSLFRLRCVHHSETFSHDLLLGTEFKILTSVIEENKFTPWPYWWHYMREDPESSEKMPVEDNVMCLRKEDMWIPSVLVGGILSGCVWQRLSCQSRLKYCQVFGWWGVAWKSLYCPELRGTSPVLLICGDIRAMGLLWWLRQ